MSTAAAPELTEQMTMAPARRGRLLGALRRPGGAFGVGWMALLVLLSATVKLWEPFNPDVGNALEALKGPSSTHWLGTDYVGRDILTRLFTAAGPALLSALLSVAVAFAVALPLVLIAAEQGPRLERWLSRGAEVMLALPAVVILLAVVGVFGTRMYLVMAVLGVLVSSGLYRMLLGVARSLHERLYVDAARVDGAGRVRISLQYILPGMTNAIAVQASQLFAVSLLVQSGLAFMGFGPADPTPSWGGMLADATQYVYQAPWMIVPPGLILALTVVAANELADAIAAQTLGQPRAARRRRRRIAQPVVAPAGSADRLLDVRGLSVERDDGVAVISGVSFGVPAGAVLGLVGESGCGKSITAKAVLGLLPKQLGVSKGSISFQGRQLVGLGRRDMRALLGRKVAMVPQDPMVALDPMFRVGSQLVEQIRRFRGVSRGEAQRIAIDQLDRVGIHDPERVMRSYPHQLSGGMAQRAVIALALTGGPALVIADEPTTALDVTVQAEILDLLRSLVEGAGIALILVSHDMGVIADMCDEVAVMYAGEMVEHGTVSQVLDRPAHPYTTALLRSSPQVDAGAPTPARLATIPGSVPEPGRWPRGCRFAARCPLADAACEEPVSLTDRVGGRQVRCIRAGDAAGALIQDRDFHSEAPNSCDGESSAPHINIGQSE